MYVWVDFFFTVSGERSFCGDHAGAGRVAVAVPVELAGMGPG